MGAEEEEEEQKTLGPNGQPGGGGTAGKVGSCENTLALPDRGRVRGLTGRPGDDPWTAAGVKACWRCSPPLVREWEFFAPMGSSFHSKQI